MSTAITPGACSRFQVPPLVPYVLVRSTHPDKGQLARMLRARVHFSSSVSLPSSLNIVHEADLYAADHPAELTGQFAPVVDKDGKKAWYFFTELKSKNPRGNRVNRSTNSGVWHYEGKSKPVVVAGVKMADCNSFAFGKRGPDRKLARTEWRMSEFRIEYGNLVLCKVYATTKSSSPRMASTHTQVVAPPEVETIEVPDEVVRWFWCLSADLLQSLHS